MATTSALVLLPILLLLLRPSLYQFLLRVLGTALGVGLGLGLAAHIHERLEEFWEREHPATPTQTPSVATSINVGHSAAVDPQSYQFLMRAAGYAEPLRRAQMVRGERAALAVKRVPVSVYAFHRGTTACRRLEAMWPNLSRAVNGALARLIEFLLRDYVASWYATIDQGVLYVDPASNIATTECGTDSFHSDTHSEAPAPRNDSALCRNADIGNDSADITQQQRTMVLTTTGTTTSPFIEALYTCIAYLLGTLGTRASENVNVLHLVLIHLPHVLGENLRIYRDLRKKALEKKRTRRKRRTAAAAGESLTTMPSKRRLDAQPQPQGCKQSVAAAADSDLLPTRNDAATSPRASALSSSFSSSPSLLSHSARNILFDSRGASLDNNVNHVSEIAIVREYLLAGRFHRALTFGLDVPSLLFADPLAKDCTPSHCYSNIKEKNRRFGHSNEEEEEDDVLEDRLLSEGSTLIAECELDYNRVLAYKIAKLVVPKNEMDSSIVRSMLVEMLAACVLGPVMRCFCPDSVNGWIVSGLELMKEEESGGSRDGKQKERRNTTDDTASKMRSSTSVTTNGEGLSVTASMTRTESADSIHSMYGTNQSVTSSLKEQNHQHEGTSHSPGGEMDMEEVLDAVLGGPITDDLISGEGGSVTSELEESIFDIENEDSFKGGEPSIGAVPPSTCSQAEQIITLISLSIIELRNFVDFEEIRYAKEHHQHVSVDWDKPNCREAVRHLVLVIEAALLLGVRSERKRPTITENDALNQEFSEMVEATLEGEESAHVDEFEVDIDVVSETKVCAVSGHYHSSLSAVLMELTGDMDAFEKMTMDAEQQPQSSELSDDDSVDVSEAIHNVMPKPNELSTLRTLIAAWLHTGQACRMLQNIARAKEFILRPFYHKNAFLRREKYCREFTKLLRQLDGVEILVDTMAVLASQCLVTAGGLQSFDKEGVSMMRRIENRKSEIDTRASFLSNGRHRQQQQQQQQQQLRINAATNSLTMVGSVKANFVQNRDRLARFAQSATESFHFGQRIESIDDQFSKAITNNSFNLLQNCQNNSPAYLQYSKNSVFALNLRIERERRAESWRKEISNREKLDFVSRFKGVSEKDALMHRELHHLSQFFYANTNEIRIEPFSFEASGGSSATAESEGAANITVLAVASRKKIEVPDEDSSFLLRAQPRPLKPVAINRDVSNANLACKIYVAMYEEPVIHPKLKRYVGGRYLRQCLLKYFPYDRTASATLVRDATVLDSRVKQPSSKAFLSEDFQRQRHSCMKVATSASLLASPLMEANDFSVFPRAGKAIDFVYRVALFERPVLELGGKKFIVHDASALTTHRADASALELSDASMSVAIILRGSYGLNVCDNSGNSPRSFSIKISTDGSPLILLRTKPQENEPNAKDEARPYRPSFIRAALLVKSAKQEAQNQCLSYCIRSGSARTSSKIKSDEWLQPTLLLLHYANSRRQEEQSVLWRDLRLGMNHIDRAQLSRNGLLYPRYPTVLRGLTTKVEGAVEIKAPSNVDLLGPPILFLFKVRCTAITEFIGDEEDDAVPNNTRIQIRHRPRYFREEWTVLRSLRDFSIFHKSLKFQVSQSEHSVGTGARLVGAATAALTIVGGNQIVKKERGPLIPSLSKATQAGALGLSSKKVNERRTKVLDEYLKYLVSPTNLLSRSPELLIFLGAYTSVFPQGTNDGGEDEYGRENVSRVEISADKLKVGIVQAKYGAEQERSLDITTNTVKNEEVALSPKGDTIKAISPSKSISHESPNTKPTLSKKQLNATRRIAMIRSAEIQLKDVRRSVFRLLRDIFDLDNASFFRSRVISVLKTMSVAVTNAQDFQLMLFQLHVKYMNGEWVSSWISYFVDMFWPNGVFYTQGPDLTETEQLDLKRNSKKMLEQAFPLQLRTVLGKHVDEGLDMLHEMLQNRLVLKSIGYMLMDLVWGEVFPELRDFVTGAECLEKEV